MANIFLLEDDKILSKGISIALKKDEHTVVTAYGQMAAAWSFAEKYGRLLKSRSCF